MFKIPNRGLGMTNNQFNFPNSNNGNANPPSNNETTVAKLAVSGGLLLHWVMLSQQWLQSLR